MSLLTFSNRTRAHDLPVMLNVPFLTLNGKQLELQEFNNLCETIGSHGNLKTFLLTGCRLQDEHMTALSALILNPNMPLELLDLCSNRITDAGATKLLEAYRQSDTLKEIKLSFNEGISSEMRNAFKQVKSEKENAHNQAPLRMTDR